MDDRLGLHHFKARGYHASLGVRRLRLLRKRSTSLLQTDPIWYEDQTNLYAYVGNDPINATDPTGECAFVCTVALGAGLGAIVGGGIEAYKQFKAGEGYDVGKIGSRALKGALGGRSEQQVLPVV